MTGKELPLDKAAAVIIGQEAFQGLTLNNTSKYLMEHEPQAEAYTYRAVKYRFPVFRTEH